MRKLAYILVCFFFRFNKDSVYFRGTGGVEKKEYEVTIPLYKEIDPDKSKSFNRGRCIEILLAKAKPDDSYWPTLTSDKKKNHWLKCDFNKWHDEDDSGDEGVGGMGGGDFEEMMRQMGGLGRFMNLTLQNYLKDLIIIITLFEGFKEYKIT